MNTNMFRIIIWAVAFFCIAGCNNSSSDLCGVEKVWESNLGTEPKSERLDVLNASRIFIFEDSNTPEDICADEHSRAEFNISLKDNKFPADTKASGVAYWGASFRNEINLGPFDTYMEDIGLKQVFKDKPAWIGLQIIFEFPTQGSLEKDKEFFHEHVKSCSIRYYYNQHI